MAYYVYILQSPKLGKYYTGITDDISRRLEEHNSAENINWTKTCQPWVLHHSIRCVNLHQARQVEYHIKQMKSGKYIENLKKYPEMTARLLEKYTASDC